jgi:hypothetical protein
MKRSYQILPPFRPPWRADLYDALSYALSMPPRSERGEGRAKELYNQALLIAEESGENLSELIWALATFESAMNQANGTAEEERFPPRLPSSPSPQKKASDYHAFLRSIASIQPTLSSQIFG